MSYCSVFHYPTAVLASAVLLYPSLTYSSACQCPIAVSLYVLQPCLPVS